MNKVDVVPNDHIQTHTVMYKNRQMILSKTLSDCMDTFHSLFTLYGLYITKSAT